MSDQRVAFVKIGRAMLDWEWYQDDRCVRLLLHLILKANYRDTRWKGHEVKAGQLITSPDALAVQLGWNRSSTRRTLDKLRECDEVTTKATSKWTLVTLVKWDKYQLDVRKAATKTANKRPTDEQSNGQQVSNQTATVKEGKEREEGKEGKEGKEETTNVVRRKAPDERITSLIEHLKAVNGGSLDGTVAKNRQACHTMLQRMAKEYPDRDPAETVKQLVDIAKADAFHGANMTSFTYLVHNAVKVINSFKTKRNGTSNSKPSHDEKLATALAMLEAKEATAVDGAHGLVDGRRQYQ